MNTTRRRRRRRSDAISYSSCWNFYAGQQLAFRSRLLSFHFCARFIENKFLFSPPPFFFLLLLWTTRLEIFQKLITSHQIKFTSTADPIEMPISKHSRIKWKWQKRKLCVPTTFCRIIIIVANGQIFSFTNFVLFISIKKEQNIGSKSMGNPQRTSISAAPV